MDSHTEDTLVKINKNFYDTYAASFSRTRDAAWEGWQRVGEALLTATHRDVKPQTLRVLDVGAGNLRFAEFLLREIWGEGVPQVDYVAIDASRALMEMGRSALDEQITAQRGHAGAEEFRVTTHTGDVRDLSGVLSQTRAAGEQVGDEFDLVVAFGLMHHMPSSVARGALMNQMRDVLAKDGMLAVSFWRFLDEKTRAQKADRQTEQALQALSGRLSKDELDEHDRLLGWQRESSVPRFCHSFSDEDIEKCASVGGLVQVGRYFSDGKSHKLNEYRLFVRG